MIILLALLVVLLFFGLPDLLRTFCGSSQRSSSSCGRSWLCGSQSRWPCWPPTMDEMLLAAAELSRRTPIAVCATAVRSNSRSDRRIVGEITNDVGSCSVRNYLAEARSTSESPAFSHLMSYLVLDTTPMPCKIVQFHNQATFHPLRKYRRKLIESVKIRSTAVLRPSG